jgi:ribosomal protein S18 acetylase RimI-like enzyme
VNPEILNTPGGTVKILSATWRDLSSLRHLEKVCFPLDAWPFLDLLGVLSFPNVVRLKAVSGDEMVGFVAGDKKNKELAWIATLGVLPAYRRQGIASTLLDHCEKGLKVPRIRLSVRATNQSAINLYTKRDYQRVGIWPNYYQDGADALVLEKHFQNYSDRM